MCWIKILAIVTLLPVYSCDVTVPLEEYDNPVDQEAQEEKGILTPALVFFPGVVDVSIGYTASIGVFALGPENLAGVHIILKYDRTKLELLEVTDGTFFDSAAETMFFFENDPGTGILEIFYTYLGGDSTAVKGTGSLATLQFAANLGGQSVLRFQTGCEFADPDDNPIEIKGFAEGVINAR